MLKFLRNSLNNRSRSGMFFFVDLINLLHWKRYFLDTATVVVILPWHFVNHFTGRGPVGMALICSSNPEHEAM